MEYEDIIIHKKQYRVLKGDFLIRDIPPLRPRDNLAVLDREIAFIEAIPQCNSICNIGSCYGGYVPLNLSKDVSVVAVDNLFLYNMGQHHPVNVREKMVPADILRIDGSNYGAIDYEYRVIISPNPLCLLDYCCYNFLQKYIYVHTAFAGIFGREFRIKNGSISFDNLINLVIMVKDAGDGFRDVLRANLPFIDYWTVLDTGSKDNTIAIVKEELGQLPGRLFEAPFINFRDSRNHCLELAGNKCVFNIMLDDTYTLHGELREFLSCMRADDVADSYSLFIKSNDVSYSSNRVTKSDRKLRYVNRVHEIIQTNVNVQIPLTTAYIIDHQSEYMTARTKERKIRDLFYLFQDLDDEPNKTRTLYYIAETFLNVEQYKNAYEYYKKRCEVGDGFSEEVQDALYKQAFIAQSCLNKGWDEVYQMYMKCYKFDPTRAESLFMIGKTLSERGNEMEAFTILKQAANLGIPKSVMNVRMHIYVNHLPKMLLPMCYKYGDYVCGEKCSALANSHNPSYEFRQWHGIFSLLKACEMTTVYAPKHICFISYGGWQPWNGGTYDEKGIGGSESFVIKFAEYSVRYGYQATVVCKCSEEGMYNGVRYVSIASFIKGTERYMVCFVNRYFEFVPAAIKKGMPTYLVLHDLLLGGEILCHDPLFKGILCISEWHKKQISYMFPAISIKAISYAIDVDSFPVAKKEPYSFIYSSFPNRGLLYLLKMFPAITAMFPAKLHVFCDLKHSWVLEHHGDTIREIEVLLEAQKENVENHGWVSKPVLYQYWAKSQFWFYPCSFNETSCLTAFEAAASRTLVITNNLAALGESVGDRGIIIPGDVQNSEWQDTAIKIVLEVLGNLDKYNYLIERNYQWSKEHCYDKIVPEFIKLFVETISH